MNKIAIIILGTLTFWSSEIFGQNSKFELGIEVGSGLTNIRGDETLEEHYGATVGYICGIAFQYNFSENFSARTNISFQRKGAVSKITFLYPQSNLLETKQYVNMDYLTIPILGRFEFGKNNNFFANIGPYFGFLMRETTVIGAVNNYPKIVNDESELFRKFDTGLTVGLGSRMPIKNNFLLSLEIRNNYGLYVVDIPPGNNTGSIKTNSLNLILGVTYKI